MKTIFTYPLNYPTNYINPLYSGDANSGFTKRVDDLLDGTYRDWLGLDPVSDLGTTSDEAQQRFSAYANYLHTEKEVDNITTYDLWNTPIVIATKNLPAGPNGISSSDLLDPVTVTTDPHTFTDGMLVQINGADGSLGYIWNDIDLYSDRISSTELQFATDSGLTNKINADGPVAFSDSTGKLDLVGYAVDSDINNNQVLIDLDRENFNLANHTINFSNSILQTPTWKLKYHSGTKYTLHAGSLVAPALKMGHLAFYNGQHPPEPNLIPVLTNPGKVRITNTSFGTDKRIYIDTNDAITWNSGNTDRYAQGLFWLEPAAEPDTYVIYKDEAKTQTFDWDTALAATGVFQYGAQNQLPSTVLTNDIRIPGTPDGSFVLYNLTGAASALNGVTLTSANSGYEISAGGNQLTIADMTGPVSYTVRNPSGYSTSGTRGGAYTSQLILATPGVSSSDLWNTMYEPKVDMDFWKSNVKNPSGAGTIEVDIEAGVRYKEEVGSGYTYLAGKRNVVNTGKHTPKTSGANSRVIKIWSDKETLEDKTGYFTDPRTMITYPDFNDERTTGEMLPVPYEPVINNNTYTPRGYRLQATGNTDGNYKEYTLRAVSQYYDGNQFLFDEQTTDCEYTFSHANDGTGVYKFPLFQNTVEIVQGSNPGKITFPRALTADEAVEFGVSLDIVHSATTIVNAGEVLNLTHDSGNTYFVEFSNGNAVDFSSVTGYPSGKFCSGSPMTLTDISCTRIVNNWDRGLEFKISPPIDGVFENYSDEPVNANNDFVKIDQGTVNGSITFTPQAATTGVVQLSPNATNTYTVDTIDIVMPGNKQYQYLSGPDTYSPGAKIDTSVFWEQGEETATTIDPADTQATLTPTVDSNGRLTGVTINDGGIYSHPGEMLMVLQNGDDTYTPPTPTTAELQDVWETDDWWDDLGKNNNKLWPTHVTPSSASISQSSASILNSSQNGVTFVKTSSFTKWSMEVTYPPMSADEFRKFHAISQAANGQANPFLFKLRSKEGDHLLWSDFGRLNTTNDVLFRNSYDAGNKLVMVEGLDSFETDAFIEGEVMFVDTDNNQNGNLVTVVNATDANVFGEAQIRLAYPLRNNIIAGAAGEKDPEYAVVTLGSSDFQYTVDYNGYYYVAVTFALDGWK